MLGVAPTATATQIKAAHRALVRRHHPDLASADQREAATRRVQEINVAYGLIRDPQSRAAYDRALATSGAGLELLAAAAGRWAGRWWAKNGATLLGSEPLSRRAGRALGRLSSSRRR